MRSIASQIGADDRGVGSLTAKARAAAAESTVPKRAGVIRTSRCHAVKVRLPDRFRVAIQEHDVHSAIVTESLRERTQRSIGPITRRGCPLALIPVPAFSEQSDL